MAKRMTKKEFEEKINKYQEINAQKKQLETELKELREELTTYIKSKGIVDKSKETAPYVIKGSNFTAYVREQSKEGVDTNLLKQKIKGYKKYMKYSKYEVLDIR